MYCAQASPSQCEYAMPQSSPGLILQGLSTEAPAPAAHTTRVSRLAEGSRTLQHSLCGDGTLVMGRTNLTVRDVSIAQSLDVWNANAFHLQELKFFQSF